MHYLLFFEFIGTSELMVVMFVALVVFGPRKLPEIGRKVGQALHQFRNVSNDFKRTWEMEAMLETAGGAATLAPAASVEPAEVEHSEVEHADVAEESHAELVPGDATVKALTVGEEHTSQHEAFAPVGVS